MAKKRNDLAAAKQRKQRIFVIVGAVVLAILLFIQVPRTMKMLDSGAGEAAPPPPPAQTEQPAGGSPDAPAADGETPAAASSAPAPASAAQVKLADTDVAPDPAEGDLASFERFSSKDPFIQQVSAEPTAPASSPPAAGAATPPPPPVTETPTETAPAGASTAAAPAASTQPQTVSIDAAPANRASAEISVNGKAEIVTLGKAFPKAEPTFRLVAVAVDSVKIGIASGGTFTSGAKAITLKKGKPLTLVNTEDGSRCVLILLSVG